MRIHVVGGGPAGLYFALLAKKRHPAWTVRVFERNGPDDTFGWGVVFSDRTLGYLRDTDAASHRAITERFATWENVDVVHRGERVSVGGNRFSGIARLALLKILQGRCAELGVELEFRAEQRDPAALRAGAALLVGADGVHSAVRRAHEAAFAPSLEQRPNRYAWYGTPALFRALTLTFRQAPDGLFIAHSYAFDAERSTFIVECDPETFERARLGERDDADCRAYLARVFAENLGGQPLLSNASRWIRFTVVKNARWRAGGPAAGARAAAGGAADGAADREAAAHVVLLGDALHTAHFSIGSGTKLALEDAVALARALDAGGEAPDVGAALDAFEAARRPEIDAYQAAAHESMVWFEEARAYLHLDPVPFAHALMRRSTRVDDESLRRRDPEFMRRVDAARGHG